MSSKKLSPYFWFMTTALFCLAVLLNITIFQKNRLAQNVAVLQEQLRLANEKTEDDLIYSHKWYGMFVGIKPDKLDTYKKLHNKIPPEAGRILRQANLHNCSVYLIQLDNGKWYLFTTFEYTGHNLARDLKKIQEGEQAHLWWAEIDACCRPLPHSFNGTGWKKMEAVYHLQ